MHDIATPADTVATPDAYSFVFTPGHTRDEIGVVAGEHFRCEADFNQYGDRLTVPAKIVFLSMSPAEFDALDQDAQASVVHRAYSTAATRRALGL